MAWYPGARKMELQPESDSQPAIVPDQMIFHSIAAPWTKERIFEYWRDSTNLESHFGQSYDGSVAQYIGTQTRADANYMANRRADGHGAISIETASSLSHTDPWTDAQIEGLIRLGAWVHRTHGVPLRICRTWDDPGFGYHAMFPGKWSPSGTACPGTARIKQFREIVFPGIVKAVQPPPAAPSVSGGPMLITSVARTTTLTVPAGEERDVYFDAEYVDDPSDHGAGGKTVLTASDYTGTASFIFSAPLPAGVQVKMVREHATSGDSAEPSTDLVSGTTRASVSVTGTVALNWNLVLRITNNSASSVTTSWVGLRLMSQAV